MPRAHAQRAAAILTTQDYYRLFCEAAGRAEHSLLIAGWDFQPDLALVRQENGDGVECVTRLGDVVTDVAAENPDVDVRIISWDFSKYFGDAETLIQQEEWIATLPDNVKVEFDPAEIAGGAHHHKIVVVDDQLAFVGGTDLSVRRWDTDERPPVDPRRVDPTGEEYPPWHDVQMIVQGDAARALGDIVREQWADVTDEQLEASTPDGRDLWPDIEPEFEDVDVDFARTWPLSGDNDKRLESEIADQYTMLIREARDLIYIANQYFTHEGLVDELQLRLQEDDGPEVIVVLPANYREAKEEQSFQMARDQNVNRLRENDPHDRLRVVTPWSLRGRGEDDVDVYVHAKLMIVDDRALMIGSANFANRSLNVDTEVAAIISGQGGARPDQIRRVRHRLLALHTGKSLAEVDEEVGDGSVRQFLDRLEADDGAVLEPLETEPSADPNIPMWFADPDRSLWHQWQTWVVLMTAVIAVAILTIVT